MNVAGGPPHPRPTAPVLMNMPGLGGSGGAPSNVFLSQGAAPSNQGQMGRGLPSTSMMGGMSGGISMGQTPQMGGVVPIPQQPVSTHKHTHTHTHTQTNK